MKAMLGAIAAFAVLAVVGVSTASASPPVITHIPFMSSTSTVTGVCPFAFTDTNYVKNWTEIDHYDNNGNLTMNFDFFGSDTFVGPNGAMLINVGGHFTARWVLDSSGNTVSDYGAGVIERVPLPDGSTFFAAGRADFVAHGMQPIYLPDWGSTRNLAGFCAALGA